jgi:protein-disulfide isomerase
VFFSSLKRSLICVALMVTGCVAQGSAPINPELNRRIENKLRADFNLPPSVNITLNPLKPSDFSGYDLLPITLQSPQKTATIDFLLSKDQKTLARLDKIDVSSDVRSRMDLFGRPVRGNKDAKVTIVNYDDFQCPFCARMHNTLFTEINKIYGDRVKMIYKDYPLVAIHPWATHAAVDANCLNNQNATAYWNFADYVHASQREIATGADNAKRQLADQTATLDSAAREQGRKLGLDSTKLDACLKNQDDSAVKASIKEGDALGIDSTPTLFINGERIGGAVPLESLRPIIDRALRDAGVDVPVTKAEAPAKPPAVPPSTSVNR